MESKITKTNEIKKEADVAKTTVKKDLEIKKYTIKFGMNYEKESVDKIFVTLTLSDDLKKLLNEVTVKSLDATSYTYDYKIGKRYKCKTWLYNGLRYAERDVLLDKELVDSGKTETSFEDINAAEVFINNVKNCVQEVIQKIMKYKDFGEEVTYTVTR